MSRSKLIIAVACFAPTLRAAAALRIWAEPPSVRLPATGRFAPGPTARRPGLITLVSPARATAACQLVFASDGPAPPVELTPNDFVGPTARIPAEQIRLFLERPVTAENPPPWYLRMLGPAKRVTVLDALVPLKAPRAQPITLTPEHPAVIWFEVSVPARTPPGRYQSQILIRAKDEVLEPVPITLEVKPIELPAQPTPFILVELDESARETAPLLRAHNLSPVPARGAAPVPAGLRPFIVPNSPEPLNPTAADYARFRDFASHAHEKTRDLRVVSTLIPQSMRPYGWFDHEFSSFADVADVLAPPAQFNHAPTLREARAHGRATWLVPDYPPYSGSISLIAPPTLSRSLPWQAWRDGHEAVWLRRVGLAPPDALDRPIDLSSPTLPDFLAYPGAVCGTNEPIPSLRLKQLALGAQETALLNLLAARGRAETAHLLASSLIKATGTDACADNFEDGELARRCDDPLAWDRAAAIALAELLAAARPDDARGAERAEWERFLAATRGVDVWDESTRITLDPSAESYHLELAIGVRNDSQVSIAGNVRLADPPPDWNLRKPSATLENLDPNHFARLTLAAGTPHIPADAFGHGRIPLIFETTHRESDIVTGRVTLDATLAAISVASLQRPITIDGDLTDWPLAEHNVAGDFRPIADTPIRRVTRSGADAHPPPPAFAPLGERTLVFLARDDANLYLALKCRGDAPRPNAPQNTAVLYEQLTPRAEDLVEILLDPTNTAAEPADLFHLVLKSSGAFVAERGIALPRRIGPVRPWPANIRYAVKPAPDGWIAEVAIPLASLGPPPAPGRVWGINFTRLDPTRGEYSNWAWSPRYCYNPRTLGRLLWPADPR